ncbi:MAG: glutaminase [Planctomycetales bacterium]|nr:glutaminase [Planctomycetales bacterium]
MSAKSGVGGGIAAVHPGHYAVAVWSPRLNSKGNSTAGLRALELLTDQTGMSIF